MLWGQNWPNNHQVAHVVWLGGIMPENTLTNKFQNCNVFTANNKVKESHIFHQFCFKSLGLCTVSCIVYQGAITSSPAQLCYLGSCMKILRYVPPTFEYQWLLYTGGKRFPKWLTQQDIPNIPRHQSSPGNICETENPQVSIHVSSNYPENKRQLQSFSRIFSRRNTMVLSSVSLQAQKWC